MNKIAKLALLYSMFFVLFFVLSALFMFLDLWINALRSIPIPHEFSEILFFALSWAVPVSIYATILLGHSYAARKKIAAPVSIASVIVLSCIFFMVFSMGIQQFKKVDFAIELAPVIKEPPGLILSRPDRLDRYDAAIVLLKEDALDGPRVISYPDQELFFLTEPGTMMGTATAPYLPIGGSSGPWLIQSISIDFNLCARQFEERYDAGLFSLIIYGASLILLLGSLRFLMDLSVWPLANLFIGMIVFRGILSLETFLNSREIQFLISTFFLERLPPSLITPLIFTILGALVLLYVFLTSIAWGKGKKRA